MFRLLRIAISQCMSWKHFCRNSKKRRKERLPKWKRGKKSIAGFPSFHFVTQPSTWILHFKPWTQYQHCPLLQVFWIQREFEKENARTATVIQSHSRLKHNHVTWTCADPTALSLVHFVLCLPRHTIPLETRWLAVYVLRSCRLTELEHCVTWLRHCVTCSVLPQMIRSFFCWIKRWII